MHPYLQKIESHASIELKKERCQLLVTYREREGEGVGDRQTDIEGELERKASGRG